MALPNECFDPEWDVLVQIEHTSKSFQGKMTLAHVKGHQDDNKSHDKSPVMAQLNVDAAKLATNDLNESVRMHCVSPLFETTKCHLHPNEEVMTS